MKSPRGADPHSLLIVAASVLDFWTGIEGGRGLGTYLGLSNHALTS